MKATIDNNEKAVIVNLYPSLRPYDVSRRTIFSTFQNPPALAAASAADMGEALTFLKEKHGLATVAAAADEDSAPSPQPLSSSDMSSSASENTDSTTYIAAAGLVMPAIDLWSVRRVS